MTCAGTINRPLDLVRSLTHNGVSLKKAHAALDGLARGRAVTVEADGERLGVLVSELGALGLGAQVLMIPDVQVRDVRARLGLSQNDFALRFGFETDTVQNWEQGRNRIDAATRMLLAIIEQCPEVVDAVQTLRPPEGDRTRSKADRDARASGRLPPHT